MATKIAVLQDLLTVLQDRNIWTPLTAVVKRSSLMHLIGKLLASNHLNECQQHKQTGLAHLFHKIVIAYVAKHLQL